MASFSFDKIIFAQARPYEKGKEEEENSDKNLAVLNMKQLNEIINISQSWSEPVLDCDPDLEHQSKVKSGLDDSPIGGHFGKRTVC